MNLSQKHCGARQVAFSLSDCGFFHQSIGIFRHNLQNLVELAESFRETAERYIELRVPGKQVDIARIKPLGFLEVGLASFPLSLVACDKSQRPRYATAIGEE